jgi:poly(3-hydroxybutyrate) depolymerase
LASLACVLPLIAGAASCSSDDADTAATADTEASESQSTTSKADTGAEGAPLEAELTDCPSGFDDQPPEAGEHEGFSSADQERSFHLLLPDAEGPRPLFVAITGTVQEEGAFLAQSRLDELPDDGWIVVAPVRNGNGRVWEPWDAMRTPDQAGEPNPDVTFIKDLVRFVRCVAAHYPVDANRVFAGGISIGGTMTNLLLRSESELFAGGIVGSGNFILTAPAEAAALDDMVVIVAWGGDEDRWIGCPDGRMGAQYAGEPGCVNVSFVEDAAAASEFYGSEDKVEQVACTKDVGHIWISDATHYMADILQSHPKGSTAEVEIPDDPPDGFSCSTDIVD